MNVLILYETQAGTTQFVATLLQKELEALGHQVKLHQPTLDGIPDISSFDTLILGAPTYHHGQIEFNMAAFLEDYKPDLALKKVAAFGLGESMYEEYCTSADLLMEWAASRGAKVSVSPLKIDGYPDDMDGLKKWVSSVVSMPKPGS